MISILIVSHEDFGISMIKSAELILGSIKNVGSLGLFRGDDIDTFITKAKKKIEDIDEGDGVLVFADLFGASPYNSIALSTKTLQNKIRLIGGFNFPMLLEAIMMRDQMSLSKLTSHILQSGKDNIKEFYENI